MRLEIKSDLEAMLDKLRGDNETRSDVVRRALNIMLALEGSPRFNGNPSLDEKFEREILSTERSSFGRRLYAVSRPLDAPFAVVVPSEMRRRAVKSRRVFISYAREDVKVARNLYRKLKARGHDPWMDERSLRKGADWQLEIKSAISSCEFFLAIISKRSVQKTGFVQIEVHNAAQEQLKRPEGVIYFIPVKIDDCQLPAFASRFNYLDLTKTPRPYKTLFDTIESI